ncbi:GntR family transcriptional regulator [Martelella mediterranea]|uniref:GntR family transcriptional regulator n=1 Tax=uncultured Martelella sp. TaxID=392331 RepID=UPI000D0545FA|nr:GntR family transcriptional regulator [uncultured Martelella sp.]
MRNSRLTNSPELGFSDDSETVETSYMRVTKQLRAAIIAGELPQDSRLPMAALAEQYGVSVQPVREALQQLEGEGLVRIVPNQGARVSAIDRNRLIYAHEIGQALEGFLAAQFAEEASLSAIRTLESIQVDHDRAANGRDWQAMDDANTRFHNLINSYGGNIEAAQLLRRYYWLSLGLMNQSGRSADFAERVTSEHHMMIDAFHKRDASTARRVAEQHVKATLHDVLSAFEKLQKDRQRK